MSESTSKARPLSEQLGDTAGAERTDAVRDDAPRTATTVRTVEPQSNERVRDERARDTRDDREYSTRSEERDPNYVGLNERLERDNKELEARNKDDGWFPVFLEWIPFAIISFIIVSLLMAGMLALDPHKPFPFFN